MKRFCLALLLGIVSLASWGRGLRVAFVGDPQVDNEEELGYARRSVYREIGARRDLSLAVFLGDLVNDDVRLLVPSRKILDSLRCPWTCVPGNHDRDMYGRKKGRPRDMASYSRIIGAPDTTFMLRGVRFVMMDDVRKGSNDYEGGFRDDQKAWLRNVLESTPQKTLVVISVHIPFNEFHAKDSLESILSVHPKLLLMCGHTHTAARHTMVLPGGLRVEEVLAGAACGSWWRGEKDYHGIPLATMNCGAPRGYYVADFRRGGYSLRYKVIGRSPESQATAWRMDSTRLVVNLFGGSADGVMKVRLPGTRGWTLLERSPEPAPEEYVMHSYNNTLPGKRRSRHPSYIPMLMRPSPHVWACDFSDNPGLLKALLASDGKELEINYSDPSMKVKTSPVIVPFPAYDAIKRKKL